MNNNPLRVAVMQPYFSPYAGYFRLFAAVDIFVILDCVQFPRRGWVHRNQFTKKNDSLDWLTLPIQKCSQQAVIKDLEFDSLHKLSEFHESFAKFNLSLMMSEAEIAATFDFTVPVIDFLEKSLTASSEKLDFHPRFIRSSSFSLPRSLKGEDRILEILKLVNATQYINLSGGLNLYNYDVFRKNDIDLKILTPFLGNKTGMIERLKVTPCSEIRFEIEDATKFLNLEVI